MKGDQLLKLITLRWDVDNLVYLNEYKSHYWLKACNDNDGRRIGITSCCEYTYECSRHKKIKNTIDSQNNNHLN